MKNLILFLFFVFEVININAQCTASIGLQVNLICNNFCNGSASVTMTGGVAPYSYLWSTNPNQTNQTASNLCAGTYSVTVNDVNNCIALASVNITQPSPLIVNSVQINATNSQCNGVITTTISGGVLPYSYACSCGIFYGEFNNSTVTATNLCAGDYVITVCDANSCCTYTENIIVDSVVNSIKDISVSNNISEKANFIKIYPNPSVDRFILEYENPEYKIVFITITDVTNKTIFESTCTQDKFEFNSESIKAGVYYVKIMSSNKTFYGKFLIQ